MGLDAVVYRNLTNVADGLREQVNVVDRRTGELEFVNAQLDEAVAPDALVACDQRLGNASMIAWLAKEIRLRCDACPLLLEAVLFSASHAGDFIAIEQIECLEQEVKLLLAQELSMSPELGVFLDSMYALTEAAKSNQNPIVFV